MNMMNELKQKYEDELKEAQNRNDELETEMTILRKENEAIKRDMEEDREKHGQTESIVREQVAKMTMTLKKKEQEIEQEQDEKKKFEAQL